MVLANTPSSKVERVKAQLKLRAEFPADVQEILHKHKIEDTMDTAEGRETLVSFLSKHLCRIWPMPAPEEPEADAEPRAKSVNVSQTMNGKKYWENGGNLKDWSIVDRLPSINVPSLVINGK